jgi:hypothetical protein
MQTENEKAVRTLFEQWWNDKCANMPILDYGYQTLTQDIAFHAFKAALQSQVSNTQQDGPNIQSLNICPRNSGHPHMFSKLGTIDSCRHCGLSEREWKVKAEAKLLAAQTPQQQEQSGEAVVWGVFWDDSGPLRLAHGWKLPVFKEKEAAEQFAYDVRIAEDGGPAKVLPLGLLSPDTPTATASQESAPGQEVVVETVARVFRDPELGVRVEWLIEGGAGACLDQVLLASPTKLTNDEGYGTVYLATPTSTAIAASSPSNKIAEQHEPGS